MNNSKIKIKLYARQEWSTEVELVTHGERQDGLSKASGSGRHHRTVHGGILMEVQAQTWVRNPKDSRQVDWDLPEGSQLEPIGWLVIKNPLANAGDAGSISEKGRAPGEGNGNPLQYSSLENSMDRGDWWATVRQVTNSRIGLNN